MKNEIPKYNPKEIEPKWQEWWKDNNTYVVDLNSSKPKYMASGMFNYPSGDGIHVGHAYTFTIPDVLARFKRQMGFESLNPVGWDSFGLPAENYAIKVGVSPQKSMATIIPNYRKQYTAMGWGVDWTKEITSSEPIYYKWTQWIFSQMHKHGLAYQDKRMQWWCNQCQTVLANEQVIDGKCWRHDKANDPTIEKKEVKQWFFKITEYADELLAGVDDLNWTESVKTAQKNWIGRSVGAEVKFALADSQEVVTVFTTRADTLLGATFLVLAPEHELVRKITVPEHREQVEAYVAASTLKTEVERQAAKEKTGVFTGTYAINPVNGEKIPVWVADYVLVGYGTGAIMAVPAHDERDNEFAKKFDLPIREVVAPDFGSPLPDAVDVTGPVVIGFDPNTKEFMSLINTRNRMRWLASGGLNDNEDYETAALRELREESGYSNVKKLIKLGGPTYSYYYNSNKDSNRRSFSYMYLAILDKNEKTNQLLESHEQYEVQWGPIENIISDFEKEPEGRGHWIDGMQRAKDAAQAYLDDSDYGGSTFTGDGVLFDAGGYSGIPTAMAREQIVADLEQKGLAKEKVNYKMRDWSVSRQRYWGAPIPIVNCEKCGAVLVPDDQLPVELPELTDFQPSGDGRSALARATDWLKTTCPECGDVAERETDTLDTYICSSWYLYRYIDPANEDEIFNSELVNKWFPIDFYDGADHATAHLLYARFIGRFFNKIGIVDNPEPLGEMLYHGKILGSDGSHFSKSAGNGVDPLEVINSGYGADALRTYLMFAAPPGENIRWNQQGVPGAYRFLTRLWAIVKEYAELAESNETDEGIDKELRTAVNVMIRKLTEDIQASKTNTAVAGLMECLNALYKVKVKSFTKSDVWQFALESIVACVAPFAPHIAEELWRDLGHTSSVHKDSWPKWDDAYLVGDTVTIVVQVNGKLRGEFSAAAGASNDELEAEARKVASEKGWLSGEPKKVIVVPGKLVNIVI
jgi:leucyl-tRNA synthetase